MAWTTPRSWVPGELASAALFNVHIRDNELDLDSRLRSNLTITTDDTMVGYSTPGTPQLLGSLSFGPGFPAKLVNPGDTLWFRAAGRFGPTGSSSNVFVYMAGANQSAVVYNGLSNEHWVIECTVTMISTGTHRAVSVAQAGTILVDTKEISFDETAALNFSVIANSATAGHVVYESSFLCNVK